MEEHSELSRWSQSFRSPELERSFQAHAFQAKRWTFLVVGLLSLLLQSLQLVSYVGESRPLDVILLSSSVAVLATVLIICQSSRALTTRGQIAIEKSMQNRLVELSHANSLAQRPRCQPLQPPRPGIVAAYAELAIERGWISLAWNFALTYTVLIVQARTITTCFPSGTSLLCAVYAMGSYPLHHTLFTALFAVFALAISTRPSAALLSHFVMFSSNAVVFGVLIKHSTAAANARAMATFAALALFTPAFSLISIRNNRLAFLRLHNLVATFELYDDKVRHLAATELRESSARSALLATMSHEIRTPLTGIIGSLELALDAEQTDPAQKELLEIGQRCADSLLDIVNSILEFSKLEAGHVTAFAEPFNPHDVLDDVTAMVAVAVRKKGLTMEVRFGDDVPSCVLGDAGQLRRVLQNLCANASKFTPDRGVVTVTASGQTASTISAFSPTAPVITATAVGESLQSSVSGVAAVSATAAAGLGMLSPKASSSSSSDAATTAAQVYLRFQVTDTGIGIDPAVLPFLFRPFVQAGECYVS